MPVSHGDDDLATFEQYPAEAGDRMWSVGDDYELSGTAGQPDAGELVMTGSDYELTGGFWPGMPVLAVVPPDDFSLIRGVLVSGGLPDLVDSDDSYLKVKAGLTMGPQEPPAWLVVNGTATTTSPAELSFVLEARSETPGLITQRIALFNYVTQTYEELDARLATLVDSVVETTVAGDPSRFIDPSTLAMNARLTWKPSGPVSGFPWTIAIDQSVWTMME